MGHVVSDIEKPNGEIIRVQINEFNGKYYLDLRIHYYADEEELRPTKKGVSIPVELFAELKEAILEAEPLVENPEELDLGEKEEE